MSHFTFHILGSNMHHLQAVEWPNFCGERAYDPLIPGAVYLCAKDIDHVEKGDPQHRTKSGVVWVTPKPGEDPKFTVPMGE